MPAGSIAELRAAVARTHRPMAGQPDIFESSEPAYSAWLFFSADAAARYRAIVEDGEWKGIGITTYCAASAEECLDFQAMASRGRPEPIEAQVGPPAPTPECRPQGVDICRRAVEFTHFLHQEMVAPPSEDHKIGLARAYTQRGTVHLEYHHFHTRAELEDIARDKGKRMEDILRKLRTGTEALGCELLPGEIVRAGGKIHSLYFYKDGELMLDVTVAQCPAG